MNGILRTVTGHQLVLLEKEIQTVDDRFVRSVKYTKQKDLFSSIHIFPFNTIVLTSLLNSEAQVTKRRPKIKESHHEQTSMEISDTSNNYEINNDTITQ